MYNFIIIFQVEFRQLVSNREPFQGEL
jgi:hypothetical protein